MADSADLVVLGANYGTGNKGGKVFTYAHFPPSLPRLFETSILSVMVDTYCKLSL